jgi:DNA replication protein DnaC
MQEILTQLGLEDIPPVEVPKNLSQAIKEFIFSNKRFLVLYGPTGTFKTTAVKKSLYAYAKNKFVKNGEVSVHDCMFVRFVDLPKVWQEDEEVLYKTKLLAIDDLVFSGFYDNFWLNLFSLIDYRYTKPCKTIITTNHDLKRFLEGEVNFFQRIASRLCDENLSILVLSEASYRNPSKRSTSDSSW